jgi:hypothetical protein
MLGCSNSVELASGRTSHVPYGSLAKDTLKFVDAEYMPNAFVICDPRNLKKAQLQSFLKHLQSRQMTQSADQVFRFSHFERRTQLHTQLHKALYGDEKEIPAVMSSNARPVVEKARHNTRDHDKDLENVQSTAASHTTGCNLTDIASPESNNIAQESMVIIDHGQMSTLISHGYLTSIPLNGPNEGPPQYQVPVKALDILSVPTPELPDTVLDMPGSPNTLAVDPVLLNISHQSDSK